ncbi:MULTISPECIES: M20 family metallopeptidase [Dethiosulfovibrio]|uniref:Probable succinyl-diaminopimelate desuccinylase n=2 Tax=Dethiosulfovibrio TaxID=47054 RepID=A0ABS9ENC1_9BACT|nr:MULTISPECIES: M20 family metallopeptidase [Dethiosulfovibrio]MCF4114126.1 M20 family metallopeptidase [Dethiosulfovibrio russensis]MCF4142684.1 M20 family metallopeptidase [Dethiosulfovibrio marinus]MCF4144752.1 M20 family metallopeptidase [Dethiosulfovibrio acidaminovorans]
MRDDIRRSIIDFVDSNTDKILDFTSRLIKANSVNPPGDEREVADVAAREIRSLGLDCEILDHGANYRSVIATVGKTKDVPGIMLNGHLDTVPPGEITWDRDPFSGEVEGGYIYGRGSSDMKAGDAAMTYATAALAASGVALRGPLTLALSSSEETVSMGAKAIASSDSVKEIGTVLIAEPTNLEIYTAEKGCFWITVTAKGKTAHGSMPQCGVNALEGLCDFLWKLRSRWVEFQSQPHQDLGPSTASVNLMSGGVGTNVIPDLATASVDIRTIPGQDHQELLKEMSDWANQLMRDRPGLDISIKVLNDRAPYEIDKGHPAVKSLADQVEQLLSVSPIKKAVAFYTDASIFGPHCGLPVVIFGPGDPTMAHQPNERSDTASIVKATKLIALWAAEQLS